MKRLAILACALLMLGAANNVGAVPIALDLTSAEYIGLIDPDHPANAASEADYINVLIGLPVPTTDYYDSDTDQTYTRSSNIFSDLPLAVAGPQLDVPPGTNTITVTGYTYLLGKYDASKAGGYVWYVGGLTGEVTIPSNLGSCGNNEGCGLSHWALFTPMTVPDGGATLMLLGGALMGLAALRRKFNG